LGQPVDQVIGCRDGSPHASSRRTRDSWRSTSCKRQRKPSATRSSSPRIASRAGLARCRGGGDAELSAGCFVRGAAARRAGAALRGMARAICGANISAWVTRHVPGTDNPDQKCCMEILKVDRKILLQLDLRLSGPACCTVTRQARWCRPGSPAWRQVDDHRAVTAVRRPGGSIQFAVRS